LLVRLPPGPFADDRSAWSIVLAQTLYLQGDLARARIYADSSRIESERPSPGVAQRRSSATASSA
jgi:hypothetical protein